MLRGSMRTSNIEAREFKAKARQVLEDRGKIEQLVDLLEAVESDVGATALRAADAVVSVVVSLIRRGQILSKLGGTAATPDSDEYAQWLNEVFEEVWTKLLQMLQYDVQVQPKHAKRIRQGAVTHCMKIIQAIHEQFNPSADHWQGEEVKRFRAVLQALCCETSSNQPGIQHFVEHYMRPFEDVQQQTILSLAKMLKKCPNVRPVRLNVLQVLENVRMQAVQQQAPCSTYLCKTQFRNEFEPIQQAFSQLWESYLKLKHQDTDIHKRILLIMHEHVMPYLRRPLLLTDFLMESYSMGGCISLLALSGVFSLIQVHNLEYPEFYAKLYSLLTPEVLHVKYRARFFHLTDLFLTSTHLPEYLVAAFVKRLSRLCLTGPADALLIILPLIGNLLLRHRGLTSMISRQCQPDPYLEHEADPSKCEAINSGLWEIRSLQSHILPQVAHMAKFIDRNLPDKEWCLDDRLETSWIDLMRKETKKHIFVNVPLTFDRPVGLKFPSQDVTSNLFEDF